MLTEQQKKAQKKYEEDSLPNDIGYIIIFIIVVIALLSDNF
jgi:hypothetical protein